MEHRTILWTAGHRPVTGRMMYYNWRIGDMVGEELPSSYPVWFAADSVELARSSMQPMVEPCYIVLHMTHEVMGRLVMEQTLRPVPALRADSRTHRGRWILTGSFHADYIAWMEVHLKPTPPWRGWHEWCEWSEDDSDEEQRAPDAPVRWHGGGGEGRGSCPAPSERPTEAHSEHAATRGDDDDTRATTAWRTPSTATGQSTEGRAVARATPRSERSRSRQRTDEMDRYRSAQMLATAFGGSSTRGRSPAF
jgi:hypothetical protein